MAVLDRAALKAFFETGDKPTAAQFADLIDSLLALADVNIIEDTITSAVPILGTGLGGIILRRGAATYAIGEFSSNDHWFTSDGGFGAVGGAAFIASNASELYFDGILRVFADLNSSGIQIPTVAVIFVSDSPAALAVPAIQGKSTTFMFQNIPIFADNAAAVLGGLISEDIYKTATGELRIVT